MNIVVCDDNAFFRKKFYDFVSKIIMERKIICGKIIQFPSAEAVLSYISENTVPTLYFLDVEFSSGLSGLDIANLIRKHDLESIIVFITELPDRSQLTFKYKLHALDYILKSSEDLERDALKCIEIACSMLNTDTKKMLRVDGKQDIISIRIEDIYCISSAKGDHKIRIEYKNGRYEGRGTLKGFYDRLDENFAYCHKSFIVNKSNIIRIDRTNRLIHFNDSVSCTFSKEYAKEVVKWVL